VQSFTPWQQATIEIMLAISLTIACSRYIYNGVILHAHLIRGESHNQCQRRGCNTNIFLKKTPGQNILNVRELPMVFKPGMRKRSFFFASGSAKILPLPHRLFDLESNFVKKFCSFPNVDLSGEVAL